MKMSPIDSRVTERQVAASPALMGDDHRHYQEISHVFHCMECDLQLQMDIAVHSHEASTERDEAEIDDGIVRVRLDPRIKLERA
jgi:hypothetical protein